MSSTSSSSYLSSSDFEIEFDSSDSDSSSSLDSKVMLTAHAKRIQDKYLDTSNRRMGSINIKYVCPAPKCHFATSSGKKEEILVHLYRKHEVRFLKHLVKPCCMINGDDEYLENVEKDLYVAIPLPSKESYSIHVPKGANGDEIVRQGDKAYMNQLEKFRYEKLLMDKNSLLGLINAE